MNTIYALIDPRNNNVFYVGMTTDIYRRTTELIYSHENNERLIACIQELKELQLMFVVQTLEQVENDSTAAGRRAYWIHHFLDLGAPLTNTSIPKLGLLENRSVDYWQWDDQMLGWRINPNPRLQGPIIDHCYLHNKKRFTILEDEKGIPEIKRCLFCKTETGRYCYICNQPICEGHAKQGRTTPVIEWVCYDFEKGKQKTHWEQRNPGIPTPRMYRDRV